VEQVNPRAQIGADRKLTPVDFHVGLLMGEDDLKHMLRYLDENRGEDLLLVTDNPWSIIWSGSVHKIGNRPLAIEELKALLDKITQNQTASMSLLRGGDLDFIYTTRGTERGARPTRFRCNATRILGAYGGFGMAITIRKTNDVVPTMKELGVPVAIQENCMPSSGIVLVVGPTGSGKSTLLDGMMHAQATRPQGQHIIVYGGPIETDLNVIPDRTAIICQTDIGPTAYGGMLESWEAATRNMLRRHPHVLLYTEARDKETIQGLVHGSKTGHVIYSTTHTNSVHMAITRLADEFSGATRTQMITGLIENMRLVVHQRLLPTPSGVGRTAIRSWFVFDADIRKELMRSDFDKLAYTILRMVNAAKTDLLTDAEAKFEQGLICPLAMDALRRELEGELEGEAEDVHQA